MKIMSWNVWNKNKLPPEKIAGFIFSHDADIICLQEVSAPVLNAIRASAPREYACIAGNDTRHFDGETCFLVTLTRAPIKKWRVIRANRKRGWRSFFSNLWHNIEEHLESLCADVFIEGARIRILNVHLEVGTGPKNRLQQFLHVLRRGVKRRRVRRAIIVGDLNIYGQGWYERFIGWLWFGLRSVELHMNEREEFERLFQKRGLKNIFKGEVTFSTGGVGFQLDHILVPLKMEVISHRVLSFDCGADHKPIIANVKKIT